MIDKKNINKEIEGEIFICNNYIYIYKIQENLKKKCLLLFRFNIKYKKNNIIKNFFFRIIILMIFQFLVNFSNLKLFA